MKMSFLKNKTSYNKMLIWLAESWKLQTCNLLSRKKKKSICTKLTRLMMKNTMIWMILVIPQSQKRKRLKSLMIVKWNLNKSNLNDLDLPKKNLNLKSYKKFDIEINERVLQISKSLIMIEKTYNHEQNLQLTARLSLIIQKRKI